MSNDRTHDGIPPRVQFDTTRWSIVAAAGSETTSAGRAAMSQLCDRYWYPLYAYVRRQRSNVHEAQDLTQAFFAQLLEKNYVAAADPDRGRFRTFLLAALNHFLSNEWNKARAQKRGGGRPLQSLDLEQGEIRYQKSIVDQQTPENLFEREWVIELLREVIGQLRTEAEASGKLAQFECLEPALTAGESRSYADIAQQLDMTDGAVKAAAHRLRQRFRQLIRAEIAQTLSDPSEADEEIRRLFQAFA